MGSAKNICFVIHYEPSSTIISTPFTYVPFQKKETDAKNDDIQTKLNKNLPSLARRRLYQWTHSTLISLKHPLESVSELQVKSNSFLTLLIFGTFAIYQIFQIFPRQHYGHHCSREYTIEFPNIEGLISGCSTTLMRLKK